MMVTWLSFFSYYGFIAMDSLCTEIFSIKIFMQIFNQTFMQKFWAKCVTKISVKISLALSVKANDKSDCKVLLNLTSSSTVHLQDYQGICRTYAYWLCINAPPAWTMTCTLRWHQDCLNARSSAGLGHCSTAAQSVPINCCSNPFFSERFSFLSHSFSGTFCFSDLSIKLISWNFYSVTWNKVAVVSCIFVFRTHQTGTSLPNIWIKYFGACEQRSICSLVRAAELSEAQCWLVTYDDLEVANATVRQWHLMD